MQSGMRYNMCHSAARPMQSGMRCSMCHSKRLDARQCRLELHHAPVYFIRCLYGILYSVKYTDLASLVPFQARMVSHQVLTRRSSLGSWRFLLLVLNSTKPANTTLRIQGGVNFFILDSRRVSAPASKVLGSDIKTHLKSRFCLQAI